MKKEVKVTVEDKILTHLKENGQMLKWLAEKIGVTSGHLHSVLKGEGEVKRALTENNKKKINEALNTDF